MMSYFGQEFLCVTQISKYIRDREMKVGGVRINRTSMEEFSTGKPMKVYFRHNRLCVLPMSCINNYRRVLMSESMAFGIGSFNFDIKADHLNIPIPSHNYVKEVKRLLESVPQLRNLQIYMSDILLEKINEESLSNNPMVYPVSIYMGFPHPIILSLSFDLTVDEENFNCVFSENDQFFFGRQIIGSQLHVSIEFGDISICIIETLNSEEVTQPSSYVAPVREYILRHINRISDTFLQLETIGPSPFHCEFYIKPAEAKTGKEAMTDYWSIICNSRYKANVTFFYNPYLISFEQAKLLILENLYPELEFFYMIMRSKSIVSQLWKKIELQIDNLLEQTKNNKSGIRSLFNKYFCLGEIANNICIEIAQFENMETRIDKFLKDEYNRIYLKYARTHIEELITKELKDKIDYPTNRMNNLVSMLDSRRVKSIEIYTVAVSTVMGGIIGGIIGVFFGK